MTFGVGKKTAEYVIYLLFWGVLFLAPYLGKALSGSLVAIEQNDIYAYWMYLLPAVIAFILNNNILIPLLFYKKKGRYYIYYLLSVITICCVTFLFSPIIDYDHEHKFHHFKENKFEQRNRQFDSAGREIPLHSNGLRGASKHFVIPFYAGKQTTVHDRFFKNEEYLVRHYPPHKPDDNFLLSISTPDTVRLLLVVFVLAFNICVRLSFFTMRRDERLQQLESEKLKAELEHLKYQINPHFFMNTLNNIHALVDIDSVKAQDAILELSKMMRFILYDASSSFVSLEKDISFLKSYIDLMRLRYTDKLDVKFNVSVPANVFGLYIPSLLLVVFVENAFKHGVTYTQQSDIDITLSVGDDCKELLFVCDNSFNINRVKTATVGGIGIENARKRLDLIYGNDAVYNIEDNGERYVVTLKIPLQNDKMYNC